MPNGYRCQKCRKQTPKGKLVMTRWGQLCPKCMSRVAPGLRNYATKEAHHDQPSQA